MVKIWQAAVLAASIMMSVSGTFLNTLQQASNDDPQKMKYFMVCSRGLVSGFAQGLYNNQSEVVSKKCMSETTYKNFIELGAYVNSDNYVALFMASAKVYQIGFELQKSCRFNELTFEVFAFCMNETNNCTQASIANNVMGDFFEITDTMNKIAEVMFNEYFNPNSKVDYTLIADSELRYEALGKSLGKIVRSATKFPKTRSDGKVNRRLKPRKPKMLQ